MEYEAKSQTKIDGFGKDYGGLGSDLLESGDFIAPKPNELFIDIDSQEEYEEFLVRLTEFREFFNVTTVERPSCSGLPRRHVIVTLNHEFSVAERLFMQTYLGSDPTKELLSFVRLQINDPSPILLRKPGVKK